MIGVVVVAHAPLAAAILACAHHIYGCTPDACRAIDVVADCEPADQVARLEQVIASVDRGDGVLVLVDLFGATPANIAAQVARPGAVEVVCGLNVPMLIKTLCYRESMTLAAMTEKALLGGSSGIMKIASTPPQDQQRFPHDPNDPGGSHGHARLQDQQ